MSNQKPRLKTNPTREEHRMRLFVEAYVKSLHLNKIKPDEEAMLDVRKFDEFFTYESKT